MDVRKKRSNSPLRTRHFKRMILLDERNDDWRYGQTASPSTSSNTSKTSTDSYPVGDDMMNATEKFSGFLADFLAEYGSPNQPHSPPSSNEGVDSARSTLRPSDSVSIRDRSISRSPSSSPHHLTTDSEEDSDDTSTVADGESTWEDEDVDTPGSPGSEIELNDGLIRRGMYITVVLSNRERNTALPCTAKVLDVHDRRGKFTLRLSKSARRATRTLWSNSARSPGQTRRRRTTSTPPAS